MADFFKKSFQLLTGSEVSHSPQKASQPKLTRQQLIDRESEIGGHLFGPIPLGRHRKFFNLNRTTWVWYEEWINKMGKSQSSTTHYEVSQGGILKVQEGLQSHYINGKELRNFLAATRLYYNRVARDIYHRDPGTGKLLPV
jgi:hypothetical protein